MMYLFIAELKANNGNAATSCVVCRVSSDAFPFSVILILGIRH